MSVAFASLLAILVIERIDAKKGTISIVSLIMAGIMSNVYWRQAYFFINYFYLHEFFFSFPYPIALVGHLLIDTVLLEVNKIALQTDKKLDKT